jgi:hypothetical protein
VEPSRGRVPHGVGVILLVSRGRVHGRITRLVRASVSLHANQQRA